MRRPPVARATNFMLVVSGSRVKSTPASLGTTCDARHRSSVSLLNSSAATHAPDTTRMNLVDRWARIRESPPRAAGCDRGSTILVPELFEEPRPGVSPMPGGGRSRDPQHVGRLLFVQSGEKPQLHQRSEERRVG